MAEAAGEVGTFEGACGRAAGCAGRGWLGFSAPARNQLELDVGRPLLRVARDRPSTANTQRNSLGRVRAFMRLDLRRFLETLATRFGASMRSSTSLNDTLQQLQPLVVDTERHGFNDWRGLAINFHRNEDLPFAFTTTFAAVHTLADLRQALHDGLGKRAKASTWTALLPLASPPILLPSRTVVVVPGLRATAPGLPWLEPHVQLLHQRAAPALKLLNKAVIIHLQRSVGEGNPGGGCLGVFRGHLGMKSHQGIGHEQGPLILAAAQL